MKKIPLRMCLGCQDMKPKKQLLRIVKIPDGKVCFDPTGKMAGRGAYVCRDAECLSKARKQKRLQKSFEGIANEKEVYEQLRKELTDLDDG